MLQYHQLADIIHAHDIEFAFNQIEPQAPPHPLEGLSNQSALISQLIIKFQDIVNFIAQPQSHQSVLSHPHQLHRVVG